MIQKNQVMDLKKKDRAKNKPKQKKEKIKLSHSFVNQS